MEQMTPVAGSRFWRESETADDAATENAAVRRPTDEPEDATALVRYG